MTLRELVEKYPDCLDLDLAITNADGDLEFIWGSYANNEQSEEPALILLWD